MSSSTMQALTSSLAADLLLQQRMDAQQGLYEQLR